MPEEARDGADEAENEKDLAAHQARDQRTMLEARFTSLTLPPAVRTSSLARLQKMSSRNVPVPGP